MLQVNLDQVDHQEVLVVPASPELTDSLVHKDHLDRLDQEVRWDSPDLLETPVVLEALVFQVRLDQWVTRVHQVLLVDPVVSEWAVLGVRKGTPDRKVNLVHRVNRDCPMSSVREDSLDRLERVVSRDLPVLLETLEDREQLDCR